MNMGGHKDKKKWSISKEKQALSSNLETMEPDDDQYKETLDAIEQCSTIQNDRLKTISTVCKDVGTIAICALIGVVAYSIDKSDEIPKNKFSKELFHKIFRL